MFEVFTNFNVKIDSTFWYSLFWFGVVVAACVILYYLLRLIVFHVVRRIVAKSKMRWDDALYSNKFFHILCWIIPLLIAYHFSGVLLSDYNITYNIIDTVLQLLFILLFMFLIKSFLKSIETRHQEDNNRKQSIKGVIQALLIIVYIMTAIIIFSKLLGKSTSSILTGLGAASAVFMLIFKDAIVGFVSGIQLSTNDLVRLGDWIEIPSSGADGEVIDITLISVKVRNWDNTIVNLPAYDLVSKSFKNWRGMKEFGMRRIKRSVFIDMNSVKYCTNEMLERFKKYEFLEQYIVEKQQSIDEFNSENSVNKTFVINGRQQSNIGVFRMYALRYLQNNQNVSKDTTLMVRQLQPTENGIPIEIYAFTKTSDWQPYENIQSDIFDHIIAAVPFFDLRIYQRSSDRNLDR